MFLHTWSPHPLLGHIGALQLHWYGLLLALGALAGLWAMVRLGKWYQIPSAHLYDLFFYVLIGGLIGARLYHVLNEPAYYSQHPSEILKIWNGGLAIHGGMIVGVLIIWLFGRAKKISPWLLADITAVGLVLGQAIGRWGNYFNQELFGRPTLQPWGIPIDPLNRPAGYTDMVYFHPTFLYESLGCLAIAAVLWWLHRRRQQKKDGLGTGSIILVYLILYSLLRLAMELLRIDRVPVILGLRLPLLTSAVLIVVALLIWFIRRATFSSPHAPTR